MQTVPVYLASIALEPQRWSSRTPSYRVSHWHPSVLEAGFDGIELWEYHYTLASAEEKASLERTVTGSFGRSEGPAPEEVEGSPGTDSTSAETEGAHGLSDIGMPVFNTYHRPHISSLDDWQSVFSACTRLGAGMIKFNLGGDPEREQDYRSALEEILRIKPAAVTLLCECHPGTIVEQPDSAACFFDDERFSEIGFIVHPFLIGNPKLKKWIDALGARVMHVHTQMRDESGNMIPLSTRPQYIRNQLETLFESGFRGSISVEFVEGTKSERDEPSYLFESAKADLATLKETLGQIGILGGGA